MSCMIAFDIVAVAQKVKVVNEHRCDLKKWGGAGSVVGRDGYYLTELTNVFV